MACYWGKKKNRKAIFVCSLSYKDKKDFNTHRLLRAIDQNTLLSKLSLNTQGQANDLYIDEKLLQYQFAAWPKLIENTYQLLDQCTISFDFEHIHSQNQETFSGDGKKDFELLKTLCEQGLPYRYPNPNEIILNRIKKELNIIHQKNFVSYFLINWEIINYARSKGYFYVGRGSGANSIVAYLLRITDVDHAAPGWQHHLVHTADLLLKPQQILWGNLRPCVRCALARYFDRSSRVLSGHPHRGG